MQESREKKVISPSFWLSIFLHLLLLLLLYLFMKSPIPPKKVEEQKYIKSYVYQERQKTYYREKSVSSPQKQIQEKSQPPQTLAEASVKPTKPDYLQKQKTKNAILASTMQVLDQMNQKELAKSAQRAEDPVYLIGDENGVSDPLIIMMAKALSLHFSYPRGEVPLEGIVYVSLVLNPNGSFSDIRIERSSKIQSFDEAALYAANAAPIVKGADRFITEPKHFVIGFVFR